MLLALILLAAVGGDSQATPAAPSSLAAVDPAPPIEPDVIARDEAGRVTVRATRIHEPLVLDGQLTEAADASVPAFGDFIQQEPAAGQPATERSEVWVLFDDSNIYVSARFWKSDPSDLIANEMRKDDTGIFRNDCIGVVLDTFLDRRSGYYFNTNALGGVRDALLVNENQNANLDFNPVWNVRSHQFAQGWSTEMAIPFKSLRYPAQREQTWGLLIQRIDWKKNELSYLTPIPPSYGGAGIWKVSSAATLVGIEAPSSGGRVEVKPYLLSTVASDRRATPAVSNDVSGDVGFDLRYKLTRSLNADVTYNTDFAQVEADNQQLNLSRFSLFFPEKREFFLEMQNIMNFGPSVGPGGRGGNDPTPILYFSRQIGLANGVAVPIQAGGRLVGRAGPYTIGAFSMRVAESAAAGVPATTFSVIRARRNVLRRSSIGILATDRSESSTGDGANRVLGLDASFRFLQDVEVNGYYAASRTTGAAGERGVSYLGQFRYAGDRYGVEATRLGVGDHFDQQVGFVPRRGVTRTYAFLRFSPRPAWWPAVRKLGVEASADRIAGTAGELETMTTRGVLRVSQANSDEFVLTADDVEDRPKMGFVVAGAPVGAGTYRFADLRAAYTLGPQRAVVGTLSAASGGYYGGRKSEVGYNGRVALSSRVMVEPVLTLTWLDMPAGRFAARLAAARTTVAMTPRMFATALVQYNSSTHGVSTNVRFRWEYQPGSDLFVVYSDGRDTRTRGVPDVVNRTLAVKFTRLFQW
ncbi:MAG: DUF5916 domain-containing protein [Vicinamibacterales bacterium]